MNQSYIDYKNFSRIQRYSPRSWWFVVEFPPPPLRSLRLSVSAKKKYQYIKGVTT